MPWPRPMHSLNGWELFGWRMPFQPAGVHVQWWVWVKEIAMGDAQQDHFSVSLFGPLHWFTWLVPTSCFMWFRWSCSVCGPLMEPAAGFNCLGPRWVKLDEHPPFVDPSPLTADNWYLWWMVVGQDSTLQKVCASSSNIGWVNARNDQFNPYFDRISMDSSPLALHGCVSQPIVAPLQQEHHGDTDRATPPRRRGAAVHGVHSHSVHQCVAQLEPPEGRWGPRHHGARHHGTVKLVKCETNVNQMWNKCVKTSNGNHTLSENGFAFMIEDGEPMERYCSGLFGIQFPQS